MEKFLSLTTIRDYILKYFPACINLADNRITAIFF